MCNYIFRNGNECQEEIVPGSEYCILHTDFPEDEDSAEFARLNELKEQKVKEKKHSGYLDFEGAKLVNIDFSGMNIKVRLSFIDVIVYKMANFRGTKFIEIAYFDGTTFEKDSNFDVAAFEKDVFFEGATFKEGAWFNGAIFEGEAWFKDTKFEGDAWLEGAQFTGAIFKAPANFDGSQFEGSTWFQEASFEGGAWFEDAKFGGHVWFEGTQFEVSAWFEGAKFEEDVSFEGAKFERYTVFNSAIFEGDTVFVGATFEGGALFEGAQFGDATNFDNIISNGTLNFKKAKFEKPETQEEACRVAKKSYDDLGNRPEADNYFYLEMVAKRKQKHILVRYIEWIFIQMIFGYGVKPERVIATWLTVVFSFACVYYLGNGLQGETSILDSIYFSIVTAATPGYGGLNPNSGLFQGLASLEAIIGTLMWATFIATFSRKYMR